MGTEQATSRIELHAHGQTARCLLPAARLELEKNGWRCEIGTDLVGAKVVLLFFDRYDAELLDKLRSFSLDGCVRFLALHTGSLPLASDEPWSLLRAGASDVLGFHGIECVPELIARLQRWQQIEAIVASPVVQKHLTGESPSWKRVLRQLVEVSCLTTSSVLVLGESGTGKELTARLIHTLDRRANKGHLVVLDCTTLVPELAGSEFFGHERGAFTGASGPRDGAFALADGGTLLLDEVGELSLPLQAQLLRVIQERSYKRLGGSQWSRTEFRLICATNRDLQSEVAAGRFRGDLYYRLASNVFRLPPLRERLEDVLPLARRFLGEFMDPGAVVDLQEPVREYLLRRSYPGNVRELRQLMSRIASRHVGNQPISVGDIPEDDRPEQDASLEDWRGLAFDAVIRRAVYQGVGLKDISQYAAEAAIRIAVSDENGNLQRAAQRLRVTDRALQLRRASRGTN